MSVDVEVAERLRRALSPRDDVREIAMFGGLAVMVGDKMVACVSGAGATLLVRVSPARAAECLSRPGARQAQMGPGRSMGPGWIALDDTAVAGDLGWWLAVALEHNAEVRGR